MISPPPRGRRLVSDDPTQRLRSFLWATSVGILIVLTGIAAYGIRPENDPDRPGDSKQYIAMINAATGRPRPPGVGPIVSPFRYRVLVPFLAARLPFESAFSLALVTYVSLAIVYALVLLLSLELGLSRFAAVVGLVTGSVFSSPSFAYINPLLTDGLGLLAVTAMIFWYVRDRFWISIAWGLLGIFAREPTLLIFPIWLLRRPAATTFAIAFAATLLFAEHRLLQSANPEDTVVPLMLGVARMRVNDLGQYARDLAPVWGWCLPFAAIGFVLLRDRLRDIGSAIIALTACAIATTFVATDVGRMFAVLLPVFAVGCAAVVRELSDTHHRVMLGLLFAMVLLQFIVSWPNRLVDRSMWTSIVPAIPMLRIGGCWIVMVMIALRDRLPGALHEVRASFTRSPDQVLAAREP